MTVVTPPNSGHTDRYLLLRTKDSRRCKISLTLKSRKGFEMEFLNLLQMVKSENHTGAGECGGNVTVCETGCELSLCDTTGSCRLTDSSLW